MKLFILGVGLAGQLPTQHDYRFLTNAQAAVTPALCLPGMLRNEQKIQTLVRAAAIALEPLSKQTELTRQCGCVITTRWDGRFPTMTSEETGEVLSTAELSPSSVALSLVPHVAQSCIPMLLNILGPALTISSRHGLSEAIHVAGMDITCHGTPLLLDQAFDLSLPINLRQQGVEPMHHYALGVVIAEQDWGCTVLGEMKL